MRESKIANSVIANMGFNVGLKKIVNYIKYWVSRVPNGVSRRVKK